jgi:TRAP transporter TAXI family solute receptor
VLPPTFSADAERLDRFKQEARTAAALNHPNIITVHEIESHNGSPYLVFELLDGQTLRDALKRGGLPVQRAVDYAIQIANALAAAHVHGVIHRDLKPENIFLTKDGRVKILDFGLAKLVENKTGGGDALLTLTAAYTLPGTVLGTVAYMSPEQVRGEVVDHRSDIFSFGAVLYEMLSGERAFTANTPAETISAILTAEPARLPLQSAAVPESLDHIVRHCLEKVPDERFQSAKDVAFALATASRGPQPRRPAFSSRERSAWLAATIVLVTAVGILVVGSRRSPLAPTKITLVTTGATTISQVLAPAMKSVILSAEPTWTVDIRSTEAGSVEAIKQLENGDANFAFVNSVVAFHSVKTDRVLGHRSDAIAGVAVLWGIAAQIFANASLPIQRIDELRSRKVNVGVEASGDRFCSEILLDHFGIGATDLVGSAFGPDRAISGVADGSLDAGMLWRGVPAPDVEHGFQTGKLRLVSLDSDAIQSLHVKNPFLTPFVIPARVYTNQQAPVGTVQTKMLLIASRSVSDDVVEKILQSVASHVRDLIAAHPAAAEFLLKRMPTIEDGMSIDLHPGAERFFRSEQKP